MEIFKFGGASVKNAESIKNVATILKKYESIQKVVIVSALGKTTNALEDVVNHYIENNSKYIQYLKEIREYHITVAFELMPTNKKLEFQLFALFDTVEQFCQSNTSRNYNYIYDQIISVGELASTKIIAAYLTESGLDNKWLDARELIRTDHAYTDAKINWETTTKRINEIVADNCQTYICQGFIGATTERNTTTLGREGSDFSAAIFSFCLNASKMVIWKDVQGILNADPREFENTTLIEQLSYQEAIEMTYYGAKVIHPKTIRPLENKQIPLYVKSFVDLNSVGTKIYRFDKGTNYPPIIVRKKNQVLLSFSEKDFSFVAEDGLSNIFKTFHANSLRMNMIHTAAISFKVAVDEKPIKIKSIIKQLEDSYSINQESNIELLTIRHFDEKTIDELTTNREILLQQRTKNNIQFLLK